MLVRTAKHITRYTLLDARSLVCVCTHHVDLGHAAWCWWDAAQLKLAQQVVVTRHLALTLIHLRQQQQQQ
jgi:hypothetical protein